ncbi:right-handed parallel beta-helix repeat-containing protein [Halorussus salinisoli]|uniref:right-handed parallel beta-helix repeat-containing protein n=1 Tax=Halorussus salinisoli TaxID=2558242 RepID=UPI0014851315|nr:right-handed parallel beta-helix repeat-containing protein [Halorussus salinisoli]
MTLRGVRTLGVLVVAFGLVVGGGTVLTTAVPFGAATETDADQSATQIDSCTTIDEPGTYVLTSDIDNGGKTPISEACIEITADDVTFDGDGHLVDGRGESHTKGIVVADAEGVTIRNVAVDDWHVGVLVTGGSATVQNVETYSNAYGVRLENATEVTVENSTISDNLVGISAPGENVTLSNNEFSDNEIEIKREE